MLEMNKEYTYQQICDVLGWEKQAGNSKIAQIKEIESCYRFYHPINKKTHKEKKSYIFTEKIRDAKLPSRQDNQGGNNIKNIRSMIDLIQCCGVPMQDAYNTRNDKANPESNAYSFWQSNFYHITDTRVASSIYKESDVADICNEHGISREKMFCEYVSLVRTEFKNMFKRALSYLQKKGLVDYSEGYYFKYALGVKSDGRVITPLLNDFIKDNEAVICDAFNKKYKFSSKMSGRQILFFIYKDEELMQKFNDIKIAMIMKNQDAIDILNDEAAKQIYGFIYDVNSICVERPIISYNQSISLFHVEVSDGNKKKLTTDVTNQIRKNVRKQLLKKYYIDEETNKKIYIFRSKDAMKDIIKIESVLFKYYDAEFFKDDYDYFEYDVDDYTEDLLHLI